MIFVILAGLFLSGCPWGSYRSLHTDRSSPPITVFDRYVIELSGFGLSDTLSEVSLVCEVYFIEKILDTSMLDTFPIFVIDTICFEGDCLDTKFCMKMMDDSDKFSFHRLNSTSLTDDLYWENWLRPDCYHAEMNIPLSTLCNGSEITVTLQVKLLDRATNNEIVRESKRILMHNDVITVPEDKH